MKNKMGGAKHAVTDAKNAAKHHVSGKARPDGTAHDGDPPPPPHPHPTPATRTPLPHPPTTTPTYFPLRHPPPSTTAEAARTRGAADREGGP